MWLKPYLDPDVAFVGTKNGTWDQYEQRQYPVFDGWNELSRQLLEDDDPTNDLSPEAAQPQILALASLCKTIPSLTSSGSLTWQKAA